MAARRASDNRFGAPRPSKDKDGEFSIEDLIPNGVLIVVHPRPGIRRAGPPSTDHHGARGPNGTRASRDPEGTETMAWNVPQYSDCAAAIR